MINITYSSAALKKKTVVALGLFDGVHKGHKEVIEKASAFKSQELSSAVFTFKTSSVIKKHDERFEYILSDELKAQRIEQLGIEYYYSPDFSKVKSLTPEEFVSEILQNRLNAKMVVCGEDFTFGKGGTATAYDLEKICAERGITTIIMPLYLYDGKAISSSDIKEKIRQGDIAGANDMMGYSYSFKMTVVKGKQLGRELNFPTINQEFENGMVVPKNGVYSSRCLIDSRFYPSVTNIGVRPTVSQSEKPIAETHIIGFDGDLYGQSIKVELKGFIRDEKKFSSLDDLKAQIHSDTKRVLSEISFRRR